MDTDKKPEPGPDDHPHAPHGIPPGAGEDEPKGLPGDRHQTETGAGQDKG